MQTIKNEYPMSKQWDHMRTLEDLLKHHTTVYVNMDNNGGVQLLIPHDGEDGFTDVGIAEDGFTYEGDSYYPDNNILGFCGDGRQTIYGVDPDTAMTIMNKWRTLMESALDLERTLIRIKEVDHDCVFVRLATGYTDYVKKVSRG